MGERGPVPKRSEQRRRRNKVEIDSAPNSTGTKLGPPCPRWLTGLGGKWYQSLRTSGQAVYYTDSDWTAALVVARGIQAFEDKPSAVMLAAILSGFGSLAATEGERRRLRIELERGGQADPDAEAGVAQMDAWRERLTGAS
jgi:hypothetical protein